MIVQQIGKQQVHGTHRLRNIAEAENEDERHVAMVICGSSQPEDTSRVPKRPSYFSMGLVRRLTHFKR